MATKTKLSKDDICKLYPFLIKYENEIKNNAGKYNFDSPRFKAFCKTNSIICEPSMAKEKINKKGKYENYFFFSSRDNKTSKKDIAHHLFRHIRNSIAHALVNKEKKNYLFEDKFMAGGTSMFGKMRPDLFDSFITELENTK